MWDGKPEGHICGKTFPIISYDLMEGRKEETKDERERFLHTLKINAEKYQQ